MTCLTPVDTSTALPYSPDEHARFMAAMTAARARAPHSYFDQHIIRMDDASYWVADEGSYETLMQDLIDRIVHTVPGEKIDEY